MSRIANFTSSQVYLLMTKGRGNWTLDNVGAPYKSYIKEKVREHRTGRPISGDNNSRACAWGNFMEGWLFENKLGLDYKLVSKDRYYHDSLPWSGMPDLFTDSFVGDIKNPWTINSFCDLVDSFESVETFKANHPNYYWQLISNAILTGIDQCELIVHLPYLDELADIREATELYDGDQNKVAFINWATDDELPYLLRDKYYKDVNHFTFKAPEDDKQLLTARIEMAAKELNNQINN